jgi:hypothetical protein
MGCCQFAYDWAMHQTTASTACSHRHDLSIFYLSAALDFSDGTMLQVLLVGVLMLKPQLVSKPAALVYDSIKAVIDQGKAQAELAKANRGVWRPA